ncbi:MAG: hypothetical protein H7832_13450 [Magnetococcus sp. DMHC-6]
MRNSVWVDEMPVVDVGFLFFILLIFVTTFIHLAVDRYPLPFVSSGANPIFQNNYVDVFLGCRSIVPHG